MGGSRGSSAHCCLLQLMLFISVSDFRLWMQNTEERGVADSRSAKTTGVYRVFFFGYTWHARVLRFSPCKLTTDKIQDPTNPPVQTPCTQCEGHADKIKTRRTCAKERHSWGNQTQIDVRQRAPRAKIKGAHRQG